MLLAVDIGNTNTKLGLFDGARLVAEHRFPSKRERTADELAALLAAPLTGREAGAVDAVAICSVVPALTETLRTFAARHLHIEPLVVTGETDVGMPIRYDPPASLGPDRLVNAVAARALWGAPENRPCVVIDYGTATKLEAVSADGAYLGGAILPGIGISLDALFAHAARLAPVSLDAPPAAIGQNTGDALRSGILFGFAAQTDGLVRRFIAELGGGGRVIATGGAAALIAPYAQTVEIVAPDLTLTGLRRIYERGRDT